MDRFAIRLAAFLFVVSRAFGQTDIYMPYRYADKWTAETLYVGPSFRYTGAGPLTLTLEWSETSTTGDLYVVSPSSGQNVFVMNNRQPEGTAIDLLSLVPFQPGDEVVFEYFPRSVASRFTGPSVQGSRFFNRINSNGNRNPKLRFGRRYSVGGQIRPGLIEFGIEDADGSGSSDMDFNDIHFNLTNAQLLLYQNTAKRRSYVW
jgi:hypothetical protein